MRPSAFVVAVLLSISANSLAGQIPEGMEGPFRPHPEANEAISRLYSPFCPGLMLEVCPASQSIALRDSIQAFAYQGWTSDQLVQWMLGNYGEQYRALPQRSGSGIWAWLLPPIGLLFGVAVVVLTLRRIAVTRRPEEGAAESPAGPALSHEEEERLRSAIRELELSEDPSF